MRGFSERLVQHVAPHGPVSTDSTAVLETLEEEQLIFRPMLIKGSVTNG